MKNIVIFCKSLVNGGDPLNKKYYFDAYVELMLAIQALGHRAYLASDDKSTYEGNGTFRNVLTTDHKAGLLADFMEIAAVRADCVLNKHNFSFTDIPVVTNPKLHEIATNKFLTYQLFPDMQPSTFLCESNDDIKNALQAVPGKMAVIKPIDGSSGDGIYVAPKSDLQNLGYPVPCLVQEFLDTSAGIPGIVKGMHDFRIMVAGGTVTGCKIRQPAEGSYLANVAKGGSEFSIDNTLIPQELLHLVDNIDQQFSTYCRYYSLDFVYSNAKWYLMELNSQPGLIPSSALEHASLHTQNLARYLTSL